MQTGIYIYTSYDGFLSNLQMLKLSYITDGFQGLNCNYAHSERHSKECHQMQKGFYLKPLALLNIFFLPSFKPDGINHFTLTSVKCKS